MDRKEYADAICDIRGRLNALAGKVGSTYSTYLDVMETIINDCIDGEYIWDDNIDDIVDVKCNGKIFTYRR